MMMIISLVVGAGVRLLVLPVLVITLVGSFWVFPMVAPSVCTLDAGTLGVGGAVGAAPFAWTGGEWFGWTGACE